MVEINQRCHNFILTAFKEWLNIVQIAMLSLSSPCRLCCLDSRCEFSSTSGVLGEKPCWTPLPSRTDARKHQLVGESLRCVSDVAPCCCRQSAASRARGPFWGEPRQPLGRWAGSWGWPPWVLWTYLAQGWEDARFFCSPAATRF